MDRSKLVHIAAECIVLLGVVSYFNKKSSRLEQAVLALHDINQHLEERLENLEMKILGRKMKVIEDVRSSDPRGVSKSQGSAPRAESRGGNELLLGFTPEQDLHFRQLKARYPDMTAAQFFEYLSIQGKAEARGGTQAEGERVAEQVQKATPPPQTSPSEPHKPSDEKIPSAEDLDRELADDIKNLSSARDPLVDKPDIESASASPRKSPIPPDGISFISGSGRKKHKDSKTSKN